MSAAMQRLVELMARLRDPVHGCPWDQVQTFESIVPHTLEEAYEVADAVARGDTAALRDELGDLLFQVVFQSRIAEERGEFDFESVAAGIHDKLYRRHPHVFGGENVRDHATLHSQWESIKADERAATGQRGALDGVPLALPALTRAAKIGKRAARVGFDWETAAQVREKVAEELGETDAAIAAQSNVADEIGDVLFAVANWARHLKLDPEACLRDATDKFSRRFARMELLAAQRGLTLAELEPARWDALWREAKSLTAG